MSTFKRFIKEVILGQSSYELDDEPEVDSYRSDAQKILDRTAERFQDPRVVAVVYGLNDRQEHDVKIIWGYSLDMDEYVYGLDKRGKIVNERYKVGEYPPNEGRRLS